MATLEPLKCHHCGRAQGPNESREASSEETLPQLLKRSVTDLLKLGSQRPSERHLVQLVPEKPAAGLSATVTSDPAEDPDWPTRLSCHASTRSTLVLERVRGERRRETRGAEVH
ncbi:hypothetical protein AGIG_G11421 [Arapaima gigas]